MLRHLLGSGQRTMMFILVPRVVHLALARYVSSWLQSTVAHDDLYIVFHPVYCQRQASFSRSCACKPIGLRRKLCRATLAPSSTTDNAFSRRRRALVMATNITFHPGSPCQVHSDESTIAHAFPRICQHQGEGGLPATEGDHNLVDWAQRQRQGQINATLNVRQSHHLAHSPRSHALSSNTYSIYTNSRTDWTGTTSVSA